MGSASELEYFLLLANDLKFLDSTAHLRTTTDTQDVKRMLAALISRLRAES